MKAFTNTDRWWVWRQPNKQWMVEPPGEGHPGFPFPTYASALAYVTAHLYEGPEHLTRSRLDHLPRYAVVVAVDAYSIPVVYQKDDVGRWRPSGDPGWSSSTELSAYAVEVLWVPQNGQVSEEPGTIPLDLRGME